MEKEVKKYKKIYLDGRKALGVAYRGSDYINRKPYGHSIQNIFSGKGVIRRSTGDLAQEEHVSEYVNVINGMRVTMDQPTVAKNRVHIFRQSIAYGFGVEDRYTLASCLQRLLNEYDNMHYIVFNYGVRGLPLEEYAYIIRKANICKDDHILCIIGGASKECKEFFIDRRVAMIDLKDYFQRPHNYGEVFLIGTILIIKDILRQQT